MIEATWFRNPHEQRNDWLRFGLMRLHQAGQVRYRELPLARCIEHGFAKSVAEHPHRHTSVIALKDSKASVRCIVDSEDSLYWMSPLIAEADLYFCVGFNRAFFQERRMPPSYSWQQPHEVAFYRERADELISAYGDHFHKARPFAPIGPNLSPRARPAPYTTRWRNLRHKIASAVSRDLYWRNDFLDFEVRYRELLSLRHQPLRYDVVLSDTLWGWPRHRLDLHARLARLSSIRRIHTRLSWSPPTPMDGGGVDHPDAATFPLKTHEIDDYESMLASSRLGVFATGFHWGWRNIVTFALMVGLPIYMDPPIAEFTFSWCDFKVWWNDEGNWPDLENRLDAMGETAWREIRAHNQAAFDRSLTPEAVARQVIETAFRCNLAAGPIAP